MAIASLTPKHKTANKTKVPEGIKVNTQISDVPDTTTPWVETAAVSHSINRYVPTEGFPCSGIYYQQQRMQGDFSDVIDKLISAPWQQYARINNYTLLLESEIQFVTNADTKVSALTLKATVEDTLIPNRGDCFVTNLGDGRTGVFALTETERETYFNATPYNCTFVLQAIITKDNHSVLDNLNNKVVIDYHYNNHYLELGQKPLLTSHELETFADRRYQAELLTEMYYRKHYNRAAQTYVLESGMNVIYDPWVIKFFMATTNSKHKDIRYYIPVDYDLVTVYDMLISRHKPEFKQVMETKMKYGACVQGMDLQYRYGFMYTPITHVAVDTMGSIYYGRGTTITPEEQLLSQLIQQVDVPTPWNHKDESTSTDNPTTSDTGTSTDGLGTPSISTGGIDEGVGGDSITDTAMSDAGAGDDSIFGNGVDSDTQTTTTTTVDTGTETDNVAVPSTGVSMGVGDDSVIEPDYQTSSTQTDKKKMVDVGTDTTQDPRIMLPMKPYPEVVHSNAYVLSDEWYNNTSVSVLETMIDDWLMRKALDPRRVSIVIDNIPRMTAAQSYYLLPIIIMLLTFGK